MSIDHRKERLLETLDSTGWDILLGEQVRIMRSWSRILLENADINEGERRGLVFALNAMKAGIEAVYRQAGREIPPRIRQELWFYNDEDV